MRFLFLLFVFLCSNVYGQNGYYIPQYPQYSSYYYYYYYQNPNQPRRLSAGEIRERWEIQDEYKERNKTENALDRKERMLDQAERAYELNKREDDLRYRGILPPKKSSGIIFNGIKYPSYEALSESSDYQSYIISKRLEKLEEERYKAYEKARDVAFLQMWHRLSDAGKEQFGRLSFEEKEARIDKYYFKDEYDEGVIPRR